MSKQLSEIDKLDATKIHGEINQLRNQQFLISLAALSFFGISIAWLLPEKSLLLDHQGKVNIAGFSIALTIGLLFVMGVLFYWLTRLSKMIARLSTYLVTQSLSEWEVVHAKYASKYPNDMSQRGTMAKLFLTLGIFSTFLPPTLHFAGPYAFVQESIIQEQTWWFLLALALVIYIGVVCYMGFRQTSDDRDPIEKRWNECISGSKT